MTLKSQLYLLQLENYDLERYNRWTSEHPGQDIVEKKGKLRWSPKARILYLLASITGSLPIATQITRPFDFFFKELLVLFASLKLRLFHRGLVVVGITGSWGKTTTKEMLAAVLTTKYLVHKTPANRNTLLGAAETILRMPRNIRVFICEMGAYRRGDIKAICNLVHPKVGIITSIGPVHLERFGSLEDIKETKLELFASMPPDGLKIGPDQDWLPPICSFFNINLNDAIAVTRSLPPIAHRLEVIETKGVKIIDDSYNSNPAGFAKALELLEKTKGKPKILVTPGMIELGKLQFEENEKAAKKAVAIANEIIIIGNTNREAFSRGLKNFKRAHFVMDVEEAKGILAKTAKPGAVILFENDLPDQYL